MKKVICLLLTLAMAASLFACTGKSKDPKLAEEPSLSTEPSADSEQPSEPSTQETLSPSEEPSTEPQRVSLENQVDYTPEAAVTPNVVDAVNVAFKDKYGNPGSIILPKIELPGPNVEAINAEILSDYSDFIRGEDDSREMDYSNIYYEWGIRGDILSVLIVCGGSAYDGGWEEHGGCNKFSLYNISISKCRLVSNDEVYAASDVENVKTRVLHAIASFGGEWRSKDADAFRNFYNSPENGYGLQCFQAELTDENFETAIPYFDEDGELCVMGLVYTFIGSERFWGMIEVEDYYTDALSTAEEYYSYYYNHYHS